jgi:hypothetical protein
MCQNRCIHWTRPFLAVNHITPPVVILNISAADTGSYEACPRDVPREPNTQDQSRGEIYCWHTILLLYFASTQCRMGQSQSSRGGRHICSKIATESRAFGQTAGMSWPIATPSPWRNLPWQRCSSLATQQPSAIVMKGYLAQYH